MNFSAWSIRNPVAPLLAFFLLMVLGWQSFQTLPITRFPNIDVPLVAVSVVQPGAAPAEMESQITKEIEDAVAGLTGVKNVTSTVSDGLSTTAVEFRMDVATDKAVQDVKDAIDQIQGNLPGNVEAPIVTKIDVEGGAIMTFAVSAPNKTLEELSWFVDDVIARGLQGRPGIGRITRIGGAEREIRIELDPLRMDSYGVTAQAVSAQIAATNTNLGAGELEGESSKQIIRTLGNSDSVEALAAMTITLPSGRFVRLSDLGEVKDSYADLQSFARVDGQGSVAFSVFRSKGASEVSVAETTNLVLDDLRTKHPDVSIDLVDDSVFYTYGNYESALHTLIEGSILAILVVLVFLRNWRATLISALALPLSAIPTFWVMDLLGFSLNLVSFLALTLATGILVDDAIVEIENIQRHIRMGKTPYRAAIEAADEIGLAVIATSATIVAVFVPVSFMPGIPGQYFEQFGLTVAISVVFSLLVARLITPMMAAYLMRTKDAEAHDVKDGVIMRGYLWVVTQTTRVWKIPGLPVRFGNYYATVVASVAIVVVSVIAMLAVPGNLFPPDDESRFSLSVEIPPGSTLADTDRVTEEMRKTIVDIEGVQRVLVIGGSTPLGERDIRMATFTIILDRADNGLARKFSDLGQAIPLIGPFLPEAAVTGRIRHQSEIEVAVNAALANVPDIRQFKIGGPGGGSRPFSYSILSEDEGDLNASIKAIEDALRPEDGLLRNVSTDSALPRPEVQITPKTDEAARLGVTAQMIAAVVRVATIGDNDAALAKLSIDNRLVPIRVQLDEASRSNLARIKSMKVPTASGSTVPLSAVATIEIADGPSIVERLNRQRVATLGADLAPGIVLDQATARFDEILPTLNLPSSVTIRPSGDAEVQAELFGSFINAMVMGILLMLMVLILLFRSVIQPITIIFSLLLSVGGVAAALIVTQNPLSMPVLIGILMLMGIVSKNAILLLDFAIEMRARGMTRMAAVVEAGHKRARPIVMTSIAMSAGMLPSALGVGEGGSFRAPMAIAVTGGIIVSTVLSLVVVPSFYLMMDDISRLLSWVFVRMIGKKEAEPDAPAPEVLAERIADREREVSLLNARLGALEDRVNQRRGPNQALHVAE
jgi:multidrug efflux pump subunit AcrB